MNIEFYCPKCKQDFTPQDLINDTNHSIVIACPNCGCDSKIGARVFLDTPQVDDTIDGVTYGERMGL